MPIKDIIDSVLGLIALFAGLYGVGLICLGLGV
jgi:hypothetical protein